MNRPRPEATVDEALRVLKPGGRIVLTVPGRADGSPDPWDDEVNDLVESYRRFQPDGDGRHGNDADEQELLKARGVQGLTGDSVDIELHVPDGETYWRWMTSHGAGTFAKRLPDDKRDQLYRDICDRIAKHGGWTVRRSAAIWQGTKAWPATTSSVRHLAQDRLRGFRSLVAPTSQRLSHSRQCRWCAAPSAACRYLLGETTRLWCRTPARR